MSCWSMITTVLAVALFVAVVAIVFLARPRAVAVDASALAGVVGSGTDRLDRLVREEVARARQEIGANVAQLAESLRGEQTALTRDLALRHDQLRVEAETNRQRHYEAVAVALKNANDSMQQRLDAIRQTLDERATQLTSETGATQQRHHEATLQRLDAMRHTFDERTLQLASDLTQRHDQLRVEATDNRQKQREEIFTRLDAFRGDLETIRTTVDAKLEIIRTDNAQKLDAMRVTVDEKLNETLDKRLGEQFSRVATQLEAVHAGLGEMRSLATGVGDLKKILSNVKARGVWGEVQLESLLDQIFTADQFERNVRTKESSGESVEFALKLPGKNGDGPLYLPIDAKFPVEDYDRLVDAAGDAEQVEACAKELEKRIRACAKDISEKYINPPATTDFAIMFLPVEGLYAEVLRRPGLAESLARDHHIMVAGPTTLTALLNCLQMGFRTLAIEKRSSEVWKLLAAVKTEFGRYGDVLEKVKKTLGTAANHIDEVGRRSRAIGRQLKSVETLPESQAEELLQLEAFDDEAEATV